MQELILSINTYKLLYTCTNILGLHLTQQVYELVISEFYQITLSI